MTHNTARPRVAILTCSFAPRSTPSAYRAVSLANLFARHEVPVKVITLSLDDLPGPQDAKLGLLVDPRVEIQRLNAGPLRRQLRRSADRNNTVERLKRSPLSALLLPDPYCDCLPTFVAASVNAVRKWKASLLVSLGYPWTMHVCAAVVSAFQRTSWVADYGDPWTQNPASDLALPLWRKRLDFQIERRCLRRVSRVIVTTERARALYLGLFPFLEGRIEVIRCGYGVELEELAHTVSEIPPDRRPIQIMHAGRIYRGARSPEAVLRAIHAMLTRVPVLQDRLVVRLIGEVDSLTRKQVLDWGLSGTVRIEPWMSTSELRDALRQADVLLLLANNGGVQVPSKLYEYLALRKPILALWQDPDDEAVRLVRGCSAGWAIRDEEDAISQFLESLISGKLEWPTYQHVVPPGNYSSAFQFERYWKLLETVL